MKQNAFVSSLQLSIMVASKVTTWHSEQKGFQTLKPKPGAELHSAWGLV